ncbi:MAG: hypothetical protein H9882_00455 [Candidatus Fournierella pullistercoris]|uniref:Histidine kinase domain-containing protein n=1 Tax=Candidatus Allofournierella pullistercoris TaxID=2838597 RepID=A0A948T0W1_9FIRM|nr:hypothetical protein [Candidatus Fournierella pullistercoris]
MKKQQMLSDQEKKVILCGGLSREMFQTLSAVQLGIKRVKAIAAEYPDIHLPGDLNPMIKNIEEGTLQLFRIAENLADMITTEKADLSANMGWVDLAWQYKKLVHMLEPSCARHGVTLLLECQQEQMECFADNEWVDKIFLNLITNAMMVSQVGDTVQVTLTRKCREAQPDVPCADSTLEQLPAEDGGEKAGSWLDTASSWFELRVYDQGDPASDLIREHLGELFLNLPQEEPEYTSHGNGLGLYLVNCYCTAMGWEFRLDTNDHGNTAIVYIPDNAKEKTGKFGSTEFASTPAQLEGDTNTNGVQDARVQAETRRWNSIEQET